MSRILDAAAELIEEQGVEAATTRTIADRAGVAYPSLYRFFADREEIFDQLLVNHAEAREARALAAESDWQIDSIEDLINHELELSIDYYTANPSATRLWLGGRSSPAVTEFVRDYLRTLAEHMRQILIERGLAEPDTDPRPFLVAVELADRVLDLAFRNGPTPDPTIIDLGRKALNAYARDALDTPAG